jgi:hypothetical protein
MKRKKFLLNFIFIYFQGASECELLNIGTLDVPLASKWLSIYYGNSFIPDRDLRIIHFCFQSPAAARVENNNL